ncbi:MAG: hypothetical protein ACXWV8_06005 [Chitinophagaceae bacterium]
MIKISKPYGYLSGVFLTLIIYFIGQLLFFINTEKTTGDICETRMSGGSVRYPGRSEIFYVCFTTNDNAQVKAKGGSNFEYAVGQQVGMYYKKNNPRHIRFNNFSALWLVPAWPYFILWGIIMAFVTGLYYKTRYVVIFRKPRFSIKLVNA